MPAVSGITLQEAPLASQSASGIYDRTLWDEYRKGNQEALTKLYKIHYYRLYHYGVFTCKDAELVLDCLQELFSRLWSRRQHMTYVNCVGVYLFKSFQRLLIHQLMGKRKLSNRLDPAVSELIPSFEETLINDESKAERVAQLKACIQSLSKGQREVIFLRFFNDLSYEEISEVMEMQVGSVYNLASKAIESLRKKLQARDLAEVSA